VWAGKHAGAINRLNDLGSICSIYELLNTKPALFLMIASEIKILLKKTKDKLCLKMFQKPHCLFRCHVKCWHDDRSGKAGIFCLGGLPTQAPTVIAKTQAVKRIVTVDGCPLNCSRKIVEQAGFTPTTTINLVTDCGIQKKSSSEYKQEDMLPAVKAIVDAINAG
jgi:uncharacterized metal-binding protein